MANASRALPQQPTQTMFAGTDVRWLMDTQAAARADHPFLVWAPFSGDDKAWTYKQFRDDAYKIAAGLYGRGVRAGDFVLLHFDNCPEILLAWYACAAFGAVGVTTNARSSGPELTYFAENSNCVAAITQPKFAKLVQDNCPALKWVVVTENDNGDAPKEGTAPDAANAFASLYGDPATLPERAPDAMAPVGVQYTSGTTSRPKGVVWTHANALWGASQCARGQGLTKDDVHLTYLPLFHTNAQAYSVLSTYWAGGTCVIQPRFSSSRFWDVSLKYKCTWTSFVPFMPRALIGQEVPKNHSYRWFGCGINEAPWDKYFGIRTLGWWGMTETIAPGIIGFHDMPNRPLSMGRPAPGYEVSVEDDDGNPVGPGERGHLKVKGIRGVSLFAEYLNNPEATENSYDDQGRFLTGDLVLVNEDGSLSFADRDKDMLKVGGENVAASEIERVVNSVPGVMESAVVARHDDMLDEVPVAFVLPGDGSANDHMRASKMAEAVMRACEEQLADFKVPREVRVVEALPRSTLDKIAKNELRAQLKAEAGR